jgi:hypothetical protein
MRAKYLIAVSLLSTISPVYGRVRGTLDAGTLTCGGAPGDCVESPYFASAGLSQDCTPSHSVLARAAKPTMASSARHAAFKDDEIQRIALSAGPLWAISGSWNAQGSALMVNDMYSKSIFYFDFPLRLVHAITSFDSQSGVHMVPAVIQQSQGGGYLVEDRHLGKIFRFGDHYDLEGGIQIKTRGQSSTGVVDVIRGWAPLGSDIIAYGDLVRGSGKAESWKAATMRLSPNSSEDPDVIREDSIEGNMTRQHSRLGSYPIMAVVGNKAYMLRCSEGATGKNIRQELFEISPSYRMVSPLPEGIDSFPVLDEAMNGHLTDIFAALERSESVVGLYGWKDSLYLLARRPDISSTANTIWTLLKINPRNGTVLHKVVLPTTKTQVLLIPGPRWWAIVEKAPVTGEPPTSRAEAIVLLPSAIPEAADSSAAGGLHPPGRVLVKSR